MDEGIRDGVLDGLKHAIQTEQDGYHFYMMAARSTSDEQGRQVFEQLAQEELSHLRFLTAQQTAIREQGRVDPAALAGTPMDLSGANPIFSADLRRRISEAHFEMSALSIGIALELSSQRFYSQQADRSGDPELAGFFRKLADWEAVHYQALLRQHEALKEDYWSAGGFAPF